MSRAKVLSDFPTNISAGTIGSSVVIDDPIITQGSDATGDVYYRAADGAFTRLAVGAADTVLTSGGAGVVPTFAAAGVPAGTIIQVGDIIRHSPDGGFNTTGSSFTHVLDGTTSGNPITATFSFTAGNTVLLVWVIAMFCHAGGNDTGVVAKISTTTTANADLVGQQSQCYIYDSGSSNCQLATKNTIHYMAEPSGTSVTYYLQIKAPWGGTASVNREETQAQFFEIKA